MKRKASISHDEALIRRLRKDPDFAAEYLKAALEDEDEPRVLLIALRHLASKPLHNWRFSRYVNTQSVVADRLFSRTLTAVSQAARIRVEP